MQKFCYLSDFNVSHNVVMKFSKNPTPENSQNLSGGIGIIPCGQTDRHTSQV
jgi:hypothetical protein